MERAVDIALQMPPLTGLGLTVRAPTFSSGAKLIKDGAVLTPVDKVYVVKDAANNDVNIEFKYDLFDAIPQISLNGQKQTIVEPLEMHEKVLVGLPLFFMLFGGVSGLLIGAVALYANNRVMRSDLEQRIRYGICVGLTLAVAGVCGILAMSLRSSMYG